MSLPKKDPSEYSQTIYAIKNRDWREKNPELTKKMRKDSQLKLKKEIMEHYGSKCACCGVINLKVLSIDHVKGGGTAHTKELKIKGGERFYGWLKKNGYPSGYQVLCMNCNQAKGIYGRCPHDGERDLVNQKVRNQQLDLWKKAG